MGRMRGLCLGDLDMMGICLEHLRLPQVVSRDLDPTDELLIIGCDGLWDSVTPADAWSVVQVG